MGSSDFSLTALDRLYTAGFEILAIITMPDKPVGRKRQIEMPIVKKWAQPKGIEVYQPRSLKNPADSSFIAKLGADVGVVVAYGKILPPHVLTATRVGFINLHASLLPKYRGASPIQSAILAGENRSGVSIMKLDEGMDTGPVYEQKEVQIEDDDTAGTLGKKLAVVGSDLLVNLIPKIIAGKEPVPQSQSGTSICKIISKEDGMIDWNNEAAYIERMVRAYNPWPSAWSKTEQYLFKINKSAVLKEKCFLPVGEVFTTGTSTVAIACGNNSALVPLEVQKEGGKILSIKDYINGHVDFIGSKLKSK